ncbi:MAG: 30S ribosomal protein S17 [Chloroflexi bacterium]|jgi:small subunit ribosomal protein S17|nr:30S ribosomal protein S17 [Chloroflexota bacterium]
MNSRRRLIGTVTSDKMDKTVVVEIKRTYRHPLLGKVVHDHKRVKAHDENNECKIGDKVMIVESRPLSRDKRWVVQQIITHDEKQEIKAEIDEGLAEVLEKGAEE